MTKKQVVDLGKPLTQYLLTAIAGFIGVYLGMKVTIAEIKKDVEYNIMETEELKHHNSIYDKSVLHLQQDVQFIKGHLGITSTRGGE